MKIYKFILGFALLVSIAACSSQSGSDAEGITEGHTCSGCCTSTCKAKHGHDVAGDFDFAMSSVCQASCGVSDYENSDIVDIIKAEVGDVTMCPVSGAIYKVKKNSPIIEHDGETFHSCCDGCAKKFNDDPERFYKNV